MTNRKPETGAAMRPRRPAGPSLIGLLKPYTPLDRRRWSALTILGNSLNLLVPRIVARAIDSYTRRQLILAAAVARAAASSALGIFALHLSAERRPDLRLGAGRAGSADAAGRQDLRRRTTPTSSRSRPRRC